MQVTIFFMWKELTEEERTIGRGKVLRPGEGWDVELRGKGALGRRREDLPQ